MLFDSHAHLDDRAFDLDRSELIRTLPERGIGLLMDPGCSLASSYAAAALAEETPWIYAAAGSHPDAADEVDEETLDAYRTLIRDNRKVKAVGEIGLDYHYEDVPGRYRKAAFRAQLDLAAELDIARHRSRAGGPSGRSGDSGRTTPAFGGCSTASQAPKKWPWTWSAGVGMWASPVSDLQKCPAGHRGGLRRTPGPDSD